MNLFFKQKYLTVFSLMLLMAFSTMVFANNGAKDNNKNNQKDKEQEQVESTASTEELPAEQASQATEPSEEESVSISSVSFNFVFYLIYKIKYADIFKMFNRKRDDGSSSSFSEINLNRLYEKLTNPAL